MTGPNPAEGAFPAGLLLGKIEKVACDVHHAAVRIHDHDPPGPHHGTGCCQRIEVDGRIQQGLRQAAARRPPDLNGFEGFLVGNSAADVENQGPQSHPHGYLHQTGMHHIPHH